MAEETVNAEEAVNVKTGETRQGRKKTFVGIVESDKMNKTIVVSVQSTALHPFYKKYVAKIKKLKAHDEKNEAKIGDRVRVVECRPISKEKCWKLVEILEHAK